MYQVTKDKRVNKLYFIVNTNAKTGKAGFAWHSVCNMLKKRQIPFEAYETKYEGHATELAREISGKERGGRRRNDERSHKRNYRF